MPTLVNGELSHHVFMVVAEGAAHVSKPWGGLGGDGCGLHATSPSPSAATSSEIERVRLTGPPP
jgi:hypothetical protein